MFELVIILTVLCVLGSIILVLDGYNQSQRKKIGQASEARRMQYKDYQVLFGGDIINYHQRKQQGR